MGSMTDANIEAFQERAGIVPAKGEYADRLDELAAAACELIKVVTCEAGMWEKGTHMAAYQRNRIEAREIVLDADPVAGALRQYMEHREAVTIDTTTLLATLTALASEQVRRSPAWPLHPKALGGRLTRLAAALRAVGITVGKAGRHPVNRRLQVTIQATGAKDVSDVPNVSKPREINGSGRNVGETSETSQPRSETSVGGRKPLIFGGIEASERSETSSPYRLGVADEEGCSDLDAEQEGLLQ